MPIQKCGLLNYSSNNMKKKNSEPNVDKRLPTYPAELVTKHPNMNIRDINMLNRDIGN